jgi:hypothetical protein
MAPEPYTYWLLSYLWGGIPFINIFVQIFGWREAPLKGKSGVNPALSP